MAERIHRQKAEQGQNIDNSNVQAIGDTALSGKGEELKADLDDLLDEIDEVLEHNAEDFVKNYIQKGGE